MTSENCCAAHGELRILYYESTSGVFHIAYTVPAGKAFVMTAWTLINEVGQRVAVRLLRDQDQVAYNRIFGTSQGFSHLTYPSGVAFGPGVKIQLTAPNNACQHFIFGYEHEQE